LSASNVGAALQLAACLDAQVTFFHATADLAATPDGAVLRSIDPQEFDALAHGASESVLMKAMMSARQAGVHCRGLTRPCDHTAEAIVEAAREQGCDLIVMASRGARGVSAWLHGSHTLRVLREAPVALLVTRVEANEPLRACERAMTVIRDEHRSLAVVTQAMAGIVNESLDGPSRADLPALDAMVEYLREFPQRLHHPKEELHLHPRLRERVPSCEETLAQIEAQHVREAALVSEVQSGIGAVRAESPDAVARLRSSVNVLVDAVLAHIGFEERVILPWAQAHFSDADWVSVAEAFTANEDPGFGSLSAEQFRCLFSDIARLVASRAGTGHAR
jgi:hemerythrin-like domain-containing protein/nucleotide-binding universal stress UspA family protein